MAAPYIHSKRDGHLRRVRGACASGRWPARRGCRCPRSLVRVRVSVRVSVRVRVRVSVRVRVKVRFRVRVRVGVRVRVDPNPNLGRSSLAVSRG